MCKLSLIIWKLVNTFSFHFVVAIKCCNHFCYWYFRSIHQRCSIKKVFLNIFAKFTGKYITCNGVSLLKKRLRHGHFHVTLRNFSEHLFYRTPPDNCFWFFQVNTRLLIMKNRKWFQHLKEVGSGGVEVWEREETGNKFTLACLKCPWSIFNFHFDIKFHKTS